MRVLTMSLRYRVCVVLCIYCRLLGGMLSFMVWHMPGLEYPCDQASFHCRSRLRGRARPCDQAGFHGRARLRGRARPCDHASFHWRARPCDQAGFQCGTCLRGRRAVGPSDKPAGSTAAFQQLQVAVEILMDAARRASYGRNIGVKSGPTRSTFSREEIKCINAGHRGGLADE